MTLATCSPAIGQDAPMPAPRPLTVCFYPPIPERYDFVPSPPPKLIRMSDDEVEKYCQNPRYYACSYRELNVVYMLTDEDLTLRRYRDTETACLLRHEHAHINGWGNEHER